MVHVLTWEELEELKNFKIKVQDFLHNVPDYHQSDMMLSTWVRAREGNYTKAEEMLREASKWRNEFEFYNLNKWQPPAKLAKEFPYEICGHTKEGFPIIVIRFGAWNVHQIIENDEKDIFVKYVIKMFVTLQDECIERSQLPHHVLTQFAFIVDFDGYSMKQLKLLKSTETILEIAQLFESQFPETLNSAIFINVPKVFSVFFSIVKHVMTTKSIAKMQIYGTNPEKWKPGLLRQFPADQFPRKYGGSRPDEGSKKISTYEEEFNEDLLTILISPGEDFKLFFHITYLSNSQIRWIFKTDHYDIGFSVLYEDETEVYPYEKCNSHIMSQEGSVNCSKMGSYFIVFDNKYSRVRGKTLHYKIYVSTNNNFSG